MNITKKTSEATSLAPPLAQPRRRWLRRLGVCGLIVAALWVGRWSVQRYRWRQFHQDIKNSRSILSWTDDDMPPFNAWPLNEAPRWVRRLYPQEQSEFTLHLLSDAIDDAWLMAHQQGIRGTDFEFVKIGFTSVTDAGLQVFRNHPTMQVLSLEGSGFSPDCVTALGEQPSLIELQARQIPLSAESVKQLGSGARLFYLHCRGDSPGLRELGSLKNLHALFLAGATDQSLTQIPAECASRLIVLENSTLSDASIPLLLMLVEQRNVVVNGSLFSAEGREQLKKAKVSFDTHVGTWRQ